MKKTFFALFSLLTVSMAAQEVVPTFLEKWQNSKTYLLQIAEVMPADVYDYKPTEKQMSFKEQLIHIRANMLWLSITYFLENKIDKKDLEVEAASKEEAVQLLKESFDAVTEVLKKNANEEDLNTKVDFFAGEKTKLQILNLMQDHVTHHRGQLIVYLNLNEIKPPKYSGW